MNRALDHYVPQLLLRGFSSGKRKRLYVFDKRTGTSFASSVHDAGCERDFYRRNDSGVNVDEWMKRVETEAGDIILRIRRKGDLTTLSDVDREWLAALAAVQMVRTKRQLKFGKDLADAVASALRRRGEDPEQIPGFADFDAEKQRTEFLDGILSLSQALFPYFADKTIVLFASDRMNPFWISDHPVARYNSLNPGDEVRGTRGVGCEGIEIYLPISSEMMLVFFVRASRDISGMQKACCQSFPRHQSLTRCSTD